MKLSFHGAAQGVTGSCHMVEAAGRRILVDCGMFQGSRELDEDNAIPFGFDARAIDFVLLTHAHLDHCGRLPLLVKRDFVGRSSPPRRLPSWRGWFFWIPRIYRRKKPIPTVIMRTSTALPRRPVRRFIPSSTPRTAWPGSAALRSIGRPWMSVREFAATFYSAGHILGSSSILVEAENEQHHTVLFSGDIGSATPRLLPRPEVPASADAVVMETTYGDRLHRPFEESLKNFTRW